MYFEPTPLSISSTFSTKFPKEVQGEKGIHRQCMDVQAATLNPYAAVSMLS